MSTTTIEAEAAAVRIRAMTANCPEPLLVESFVPGDEVAVEGLLTGGRLEVLAVFDKPDPLDGPFFEETIYVTPSRQPPAILTEIESTAARAATALGLREGPVHAELRIGPGGAVIILELAARSIGGLCARALQVRSGGEPRRGDHPARPRHGARWPHPGVTGIGRDDAPDPLGRGTRPRVGTGTRPGHRRSGRSRHQYSVGATRWCHCPKAIATWGSSSPGDRHRRPSKRPFDRQRHVSTCACAEASLRRPRPAR